MIKAARQEYQVLLRVHGQHDEAAIGEPVECFDDRLWCRPDDGFPPSQSRYYVLHGRG